MWHSSTSSLRGNCLQATFSNFVFNIVKLCIVWNYLLWMKHPISANDLILKPQVSWKLCFPSTAHWNGDRMGWSKRICFLMRQNVIHLNWDTDRKSNQCPGFDILTKSLSAWAEQKYTHTQNAPTGYKIQEEIIFQHSWNGHVA